MRLAAVGPAVVRVHVGRGRATRGRHGGEEAREDRHTGHSKELLQRGDSCGGRVHHRRASGRFICCQAGSDRGFTARVDARGNRGVSAAECRARAQCKRCTAVPSLLGAASQPQVAIKRSNRRGVSPTARSEVPSEDDRASSSRRLGDVSWRLLPDRVRNPELLFPADHRLRHPPPTWGSAAEGRSTNSERSPLHRTALAASRGDRRR